MSVCRVCLCADIAPRVAAQETRRGGGACAAGSHHAPRPAVRPDVAVVGQAADEGCAGGHHRRRRRRLVASGSRGHTRGRLVAAAAAGRERGGTGGRRVLRREERVAAVRRGRVARRRGGRRDGRQRVRVNAARLGVGRQAEGGGARGGGRVALHNLGGGGGEVRAAAGREIRAKRDARTENDVPKKLDRSEATTEAASPLSDVEMSYWEQSAPWETGRRAVNARRERLRGCAHRRARRGEQELAAPLAVGGAEEEEVPAARRGESSARRSRPLPRAWAAHRFLPFTRSRWMKHFTGAPSGPCRCT